MGTEFFQDRPPTLFLVEENDRFVDGDREHLVFVRQAREFLASPHEGPVAAQPGHDFFAGLRIGTHRPWQGEQA